MFSPCRGKAGGRGSGHIKKSGVPIYAFDWAAGDINFSLSSVSYGLVYSNKKLFLSFWWNHWVRTWEEISFYHYPAVSGVVLLTRYCWSHVTKNVNEVHYKISNVKVMHYKKELATYPVPGNLLRCPLRSHNGFLGIFIFTFVTHAYHTLLLIKINYSLREP